MRKQRYGRGVPRFSALVFLALFIVGANCAAGDENKREKEIDDKLIDKGGEFIEDLIRLPGEHHAHGPSVPGAFLRIEVLDPAGRPTDARLTLTRADGATREAATTAGRATLTDIAPARYTLTLAPVRNAPPPARRFEVRSRGDNLLLRVMTGAPTTTRAAEPRASPPPAPPPSSPWLGSGRRLVAQGSIVDVAGRPTDATLRIFRDGVEIGYISSTAGRFSLYDLARGDYVARARGRHAGEERSQPFTIGSGLSRLTIRVP